MKRTIIYIITAILAVACSKPEHPETPADGGVLRDVRYSLTRAGLPTPAEKTTYTFVSYNRNSDGTYGPNTTTSDASSNAAYKQQPIGYYAYLSDAEYYGILQPCEVDDAYGTKEGVPYGFVKREPQEGQALYDGNFRTVCLHPAMPVERIVATGSDRVRFERTEALYASEPFDMRVDGYEIFELDLEADPDTNPTNDPDLRKNRPLIEVRSKILVDFVQGSDYEFTLDNVRLTNPGAWGWYQPLLQVTNVSYMDSADPDDIYETDINETAGNEIALNVSSDDGDASVELYDYTDPDNTVKGDVLYSTTSRTLGESDGCGFFFFSNDYTKGNLLEPGIAFDLLMNGEGFAITVPLTMHMQRGYAYRFRLTVESLVIRATFQVVDWETGQAITDPDLGGGQEQILGIWTPEGWTDTYNSGGDIGTPNP